ncbi:hypothetical protein ACAF76_005180 [Brevibacillus sp. TJ4]|uniref:hypothetical protein n=1 Tax=Brevibacillus sp. TJ4 TaxID=3234853 RepID=UPI0037CF3D78
MQGNPLFKTYQQITDQLVLFNEEHYLGVAKVNISSMASEVREALFNLLYEFDSPEMEIEIDVSEEEKGTWYVQLLVPHVLTLPEAAIRRIDKGMEQLAEHVRKSKAELEQMLLRGEDIYEYVKRYNPDLKRVV